MKRLTLSLGLLSLVAVLAACSGASATPASSGPAAPSARTGDAITITAKDLKFGQSEVSIPAAKAFDLVFDNQDGAPHNVAIVDASGKTIFKGEIVSSQQVTYQVPALPAGTYAFACEVHPDMKGIITAG